MGNPPVHHQNTGLQTTNLWEALRRPGAWGVKQSGAQWAEVVAGDEASCQGQAGFACGYESQFKKQREGENGTYVYACYNIYIYIITCIYENTRKFFSVSIV